MSDDSLWDSLEPDPVLVRRDNASKLRYVATQLPTLEGKPYLATALSKTLHEVALELDTAQQDRDEYASVKAARKALQDLRSALPHVGREIDLSLRLSRQHNSLRRKLSTAMRATADARRRHLSTVKEAKRQAARADAAEAALAALKKEQR